MRTVEDIRNTLLKDGINFALVMAMTNEELKTADDFEDYSEYNRYMNFMARKYNI